jgi:hypothetical protein
MVKLTHITFYNLFQLPEVAPSSLCELARPTGRGDFKTFRNIDHGCVILTVLVRLVLLKISYCSVLKPLCRYIILSADNQARMLNTSYIQTNTKIKAFKMPTNREMYNTPKHTLHTYRQTQR